MSHDKRRRMLVMVLVCVVCAGAAAVYIGFASRRGDRIMDWNAGDTIPLGRGMMLRVVALRDHDADKPPGARR